MSHVLWRVADAIQEETDNSDSLAGRYDLAAAALREVADWLEDEAITFDGDWAAVMRIRDRIRKETNHDD